MRWRTVRPAMGGGAKLAMVSRLGAVPGRAADADSLQKVTPVTWFPTPTATTHYRLNGFMAASQAGRLPHRSSRKESGR